MTSRPFLPPAQAASIPWRPTCSQLGRLLTQVIFKITNLFENIHQRACIFYSTALPENDQEWNRHHNPLLNLTSLMLFLSKLGSGYCEPPLRYCISKVTCFKSHLFPPWPYFLTIMPVEEENLRPFKTHSYVNWRVIKNIVLQICHSRQRVSTGVHTRINYHRLTGAGFLKIHMGQFVFPLFFFFFFGLSIIPSRSQKQIRAVC